MGICLFYIESEDTSISRVCYGQMIISLFVISYHTLVSCSRFVETNLICHLVCFIFGVYLRLLYVIRYFQIPGEICDKYYKTFFYLRIQAYIDLISVIFSILLVIALIFVLSIQCCAAYCPNIIGLHSFLVDISSALNGGASTTVIKFVVSNMPRTKFNPELHTDYKECVICMEEFVRDMEIIELPCDKRHYFHSECIMDWIEKARKVSCPICRKDMSEELKRLHEERKVQTQVEDLIVT